MMYNVILTDGNYDHYFIGSDNSVVSFYNKDNSFKYEFEDYEDADNVRTNYILSNREFYNVKSIKVEQL